MGQINAGDLNSVIRIERLTDARDPTFNTQLDAWESIDFLPGSPSTPRTFAAQVLDVLGGSTEREDRAQLAAVGRTRVRMRYRSDVNSEMRIVVLGANPRTLQIVTPPAEIGYREGLEFYCERFIA